MRQETFISIDVETTGPVPGLYAMIELGACTADRKHEFSACLRPDAAWHQDTLNWWYHPNRINILKAIQEDARYPMQVMEDFAEWINQFKHPVLFGFPATFDFGFVHYYWWRYIKKVPPFGHRALDGKTLAMLALKSGYTEASKRLLHKTFPDYFLDSLPHTHRALDDAREQAHLFSCLMDRQW